MQTDRQTDKSSRWVFTVQEGQYHLFDTMPNIVAEWGWQDEIAPTTGSKHRQGYLRTRSQVRFSAIRKLFPDVHFEVARDWNKAVNYCKKAETRDPNGQQVHSVNQREYLQLHTALRKIARVWVQPEYDDPKEASKKQDYAYWNAVKVLLATNPEDISFYAEGKVKSAWINTRDFWLSEIWAEEVEAEIDCASVSADFVSTE